MEARRRHAISDNCMRNYTVASTAELDEPGVMDGDEGGIWEHEDHGTEPVVDGGFGAW